MESRADKIAARIDAVDAPVKWLELYAKFAVFIVPKNTKVETVGEFDNWSVEEIEAEIKKIHAKAGKKLVPMDSRARTEGE